MKQEISYSYLKSTVDSNQIIILTSLKLKKCMMIPKTTNHRISILNLWIVTTFTKRVSSTIVNTTNELEFGKSMRLLIKTFNCRETITTITRLRGVRH